MAFDGNPTNQYTLSTDANQHLAGTVGGVNSISATPVTREAWHHCVFTHDGTNIRVYLDAILVSGPTAAGAPVSVSRQIWIGSSGVPSGIAYGAMAEVATYPVALSAARVTAHFLAADQTTQAPVYRGLAYSTDNGQTQLIGSTDLSSVLAAVRKTFPTT